MNNSEFRDALDQVGDRGEVRGADAVFAAATSTDTALDRATPKSRRGRGRSLLVAAAVVSVLLITVGVVRRDREPVQVQTTPSSAPEASHRVRVAYRSTEVRGLNVNGTPDTTAETQDLARTVHARLDAYTGHDVPVEADGATVIATIPTSIPPDLLDLLLSPIGRLAINRIDRTVTDPNCGQDPTSSTVATREGTWPKWGPVRGCYAFAQSNPASLVWTGRDLVTTLAPGASVQVHPVGNSAEVVIQLPAASDFHGSAVCTPEDFCVAGDGGFSWAVVLDNVATNDPSPTTPTSATITGLAPPAAEVLKAILLAPAYLNAVTVTDLDTPPATTPAPPSVPAADVRAADIAAIKSSMAQSNDGWNSGVTSGLEAKAATAWPPGQVTKANVVCSYGAAQSGTVPRPLDQVETVLVRDGITEHMELVSDDSVQDAPGWTIPTDGFLRAGTVPTGRIYKISARVTRGITGQITDGSTQTTDLHVTVIDDKAYFFPQLC